MSIDSFCHTFNFTLAGVKFDPEQDWKAGRGLMGTLSPKFMAQPDLSDVQEPRRPDLRLCKMAANGHLQLPDVERKKWLEDPIRSN